MGFFTGSAGGIVSGITGLVGGILQNKANKKAAAQNFEYQKQLQTQEFQQQQHLAEYEHQKNLEMWHLQNDYNTPEAQIKRYQDAGLNPNLLYGNISSGNASSIPQYQAPRTDYSGLRSVRQPATNWEFLQETINAFMQFESWKADQKIKEETANNLRERSRSEMSKRALHAIDKELKQLAKTKNFTELGFGIDKHNEWLKLQSQRQRLLDYQVNTAMWNEKVASRRAKGITDNPHSWAGILNNAINSWMYENGGSSYSEQIGKWVYQLQNLLPKKLNPRHWLFGN